MSGPLTTEKNILNDIQMGSDGGSGNYEDQVGGSTGSMPDVDSSRRNAWMTVAGSWLILFGTLGYVYSFGVYEDYYTRIFLRGQSPSNVSWMGSLQLALPFAIGPLAGKFFDAGYVRLPIASGSLLYIFSLFMLSLAKEGQYYQVFLSQGLGMGLGAGLLFTPIIAIVGSHFKRRRSFALGTVMTGMSLGAVAFPILINQLIPKIGFANAVRVSGYIILGCLVVGNLLIRLPPRPSKQAGPVDILSFFRDSVYLWYLFMSVITLLSIYFPSVYLQLYAVEHNIDNTLAFYSLAILNGVGTIGRIGGSLAADRYGIWNMMIPTGIGSAVTIWIILAIHNSASLIIISCLYGVFSGAWFVIGVSGLVALAKSPSEIGARTGIANAFMGVACLVSGPIQGALLSTKFLWLRPVAFSGTLMIVSTALCVIIRMLISRRKKSQWV